MRRGVLIVVVCFLTTYAPSAEPPATPEAKTGSRTLSGADQRSLPPSFQKLFPLHEPLGPPGPSDWLAGQEETGQTYRQFIADDPVRATAQRRTLYIQPLGDFTADQQRVVDRTADFLGRFYQLPVQIEEAWSLSTIPPEARRDQPITGKPQILSTYILETLKTRVPADAAAMIVLTASDLWPGDDWNFVFGQAFLQSRVGVWSMYRFGDPSRDEAAFQLTLRRTLKIAAHETGHMFSLDHCVYYECALNGTNSIFETDRHPLWLCPQCLAKLCYATGADPHVRFQKLIDFAKQEKLAAEAEFWERSLKALGTPVRRRR